MKGTRTDMRRGFLACALVLAMSLGGCDYWPPALLAQLEQLRSTVQDLSDERAQLEAQLREATLLRDELQGRLNEATRENGDLKVRLARLERDLERGQTTVARRAEARPKRAATSTSRPAAGGRVLALKSPAMRGKDVKAVQLALKDLGVPVQVDGYFGADTKAAVVWFQRKHGLQPDGVVGNKTRALIERRAVFARTSDDGRVIRLKRPPMQGSDVKSIQRALRHAGVKVRVDGAFGAQTQDAVKRFQRKQGLPADGVVGPATREALGLS